MIKTEIDTLYKTSDGTFVYERPQSELNLYKKRREAAEKSEREFLSLKNKINIIDSDISEIKQMLAILLRKADK